MLTKTAFTDPKPLEPHIESPLTRAEVDDIERLRLDLAARTSVEFADWWADRLSHSWRLRAIYRIGGHR